MCVLLLAAAAGLYITALNVVHYENGSGAATTWAPEPTAPCAAAGCAEPPASSPPDLSAAYARQVSSLPRSAGGYASWFHALALRGLHRALLASCVAVAEHPYVAFMAALVFALIIEERVRGLDPVTAAPTVQTRPQPQPPPVAAAKRYDTARGARGSGAARAAATAAAAQEAALEALKSTISDMDKARARAQVRAQCHKGAFDVAFDLALQRLEAADVDNFRNKTAAEKDVLALNLASHRGMWRPFYENFMRDAGEETDDEDDGAMEDDGAFPLADIDEDWEDGGEW
jgi:hypothetical protein